MAKGVDTPVQSETPAENIPATNDVAEATASPEFNAGPPLAELSLRDRSLNPEKQATADAMLTIVTAQGYNDKGYSIGTVSGATAYDSAAEAKDGAKAMKNLLGKVAPTGKRVGVTTFTDAENKHHWALYLANSNKSSDENGDSETATEENSEAPAEA